jgi:hypothetical protein
MENSNGTKALFSKGSEEILIRTNAALGLASPLFSTQTPSFPSLAMLETDIIQFGSMQTEM